MASTKDYPILNEILREVDTECSADTVERRLADTTFSADEYIQWAQHYPKVKVIEATVPEGIFPYGTEAKLADVRINSHGPDDEVYDRDELLRQRVARGNAFIKIGTGSWQCITYGLKKFTGGMGDDDDRSNGGSRTIWQNYFTKDVCDARKVITIRKANGEAAHFSCIKHEGVVYYCVGSKNVHMVMTEETHIHWYTDSRYQYAKEIATAVLDFLGALPDDKRKRLTDFLCETKLTANMEILNPLHAHVEDLSYLGDKCALKFITWTSTRLAEKNVDFCIMPPHVALRVARCLGFDALEYKEIPIEEAESHMSKVRMDYGYEGEVFYYLDDQGDVIGLVKKKTAWYIILRAIREKVRNALSNAKRPTSDVEKKIKQRIKEIQNWLKLDNQSTQEYQKLGVDFYAWAREKRVGSRVASEFPVLWQDFLKGGGRTDRVKYSSASPE